MTEALGMRDRVRLELEPDHIGVWADQRSNGRPGSDPADLPESVTGSQGRATELTRHLRVSARDERRS
jgi:hypothetical protein